MALIKCKECGNGISKTAKSCPKCGAKNKKPIGIVGGIFLIFFTLMFIGILSSLINSPPTSSGSQSQSAEPIDVAPDITDEQSKSAALHIRKKTDEVKGITWYHHQNSPKYSNSRTSLSVYFGTSGSSPEAPRLLIQYVSDDWLFVEKFIVRVDNASYEISPKYSEIERDNGTLSNGEVGIWEWYDNTMTRENMEMILAIINSKKTVVRFEGRQYYKDYTVSQSDKTGCKETLAVWKQMGGIFR